MWRWLGILKYGAAYIPFDADAPPELIGECLADCEARFVIIDAITSEKLDRPLPATAIPCPDLMAAGADGPAPDLRADGVTPNHPAYAIYTSGSIGKPKGIVIEQQNICHYLRSANTVYGMGAEDVVFQGASIAFDLSPEEIFIPYLVAPRCGSPPRACCCWMPSAARPSCPGRFASLAPRSARACSWIAPDITEFDCVTVGDYAAVNATSNL